MRAMVLAVPVLTLAMLAGCNTVEGVGQDLQTAGAAVSQEARKAQ